MRQETVEKLNGYGTLLRFVTPALLGVLVWIVQDMKHDLHTLSNDYYHQLSQINTRLGVLEGRLSVK